MYTTEAEYEAYTSNTAPTDYDRQELYAVTLFKTVFPNFPSETMMADLDATTSNCVKNAIFEQIDFADGVDPYSGSNGSGESFSVGNFSITGASNTANDKMSFMAMSFLETCGADHLGVGGQC